MNSKLSVAILAPSLLVSAALNVLQGKRLVELERTLTGAGGAEPGRRAATLRVTDTAGAPAILQLGAPSTRPRVLYIFSPSCGWCRHDVDAVNSLVSQISNRYDAIGLSMSDVGLLQFSARYRRAFPVYLAGPSSDAVSQYALRSTPETIVISSKGTILARWRGAYEGATRRDVEKFFGAKLPQTGS